MKTPINPYVLVDWKCAKVIPCDYELILQSAIKFRGWVQYIGQYYSTILDGYLKVDGFLSFSDPESLSLLHAITNYT